MKPIAVFLAWAAWQISPPWLSPASLDSWAGVFSEPINPIASRLDRGWNIGAGAGIVHHRAQGSCRFTQPAIATVAAFDPCMVSCGCSDEPRDRIVLCDEAGVAFKVGPLV